MLPPPVVEEEVLAPDRPLAGQTPLIQQQSVGKAVSAALVEQGAVRRYEPLAAAVTEIRLGRTQAVPIRRSLHASALHGDELALDAEQPLDNPLRLSRSVLRRTAGRG